MMPTRRWRRPRTARRVLEAPPSYRPEPGCHRFC